MPKTDPNTVFCGRDIFAYNVEGPLAMFSEPFTKTGGERHSYPVPTYSVLTGITRGILWKPTLIYRILDVRVMNEIKMEPMSVNTRSYGTNQVDRFKHYFLTNVRYQVRVQLLWNMNRPEFANDRNITKFRHMIARTVASGGRRDIYLGTRDCQAYVTPCDFEAGQDESFYKNSGKISFGHMVHGFTYADEAIREEDKGKMTERYWDQEMINGVIHFLAPEECTHTRHVRDMKPKVFVPDWKPQEG